MSNKAIDLSQFDGGFRNEQVDTRADFDSVPDGKYQVNVEKVELTETHTSGNPMLKWTLRIIAPQQVNRLMWRNSVITAKTLKFLKTDLHVCGLDPLRDVFGNFPAAAQDELAGVRVLDVLRRGAAQDALGERRDHLPAVDFGLYGHAVLGAAILGRDDAVVRHVDQTAGEITRVRRLECGVGETLTRTVSRDEVLEHREAFAEVRGDGRFDDLALSLIHI